MDLLHAPGPLERRFGAALIASLAVHAVALSVSPPTPRVALFEPPPVLQVALRELTVPSAAPPEAPAPAPEKPRQPAPRKHEPTPLAREAEPPAPDQEPLRAAPPSPEPPLAAPAAPPQPPVALQVPLPRVPPSDLLPAYGQAISQALARYREYPRIAQMQGWQGTVTMRLRVAQSGRLLDAEVHISSGYEALDRQALAMASRAERLPAPPEGLRDPEITVLVPIVFRLAR